MEEIKVLYTNVGFFDETEDLVWEKWNIEH